jgi:hypothetical protein
MTCQSQTSSSLLGMKENCAAGFFMAQNTKTGKFIPNDQKYQMAIT